MRSRAASAATPVTRYSAESLIAALNTGVEESLWGAVRALEEAGMLLMELSRVSKLITGRERRAAGSRAGRRQAQAAAIREILQRTLEPAGARDRSGVLQPALQQRVPHDVDAAADAELVHRVGLVRLDGLDAQIQPRGDLLVGVTPGDQPDDFGLPRTQRRFPDRLRPPSGGAGSRPSPFRRPRGRDTCHLTTTERIACSSSAGRLCLST